jgi:hypothetical protein
MSSNRNPAEPPNARVTRKIRLKERIGDVHRKIQIPLQRPDKAARLTVLGAVVGLWQMRDFSRRDQAIRT